MTSRLLIVLLLGLFSVFTSAQVANKTFGEQHKIRINSNGSLGIDLSDLSPASSFLNTNNHYINQAGLWLVAEDYAGNHGTSVQYLAAIDSFDFWPGPVDTLTGQTDPISAWDNVWEVDREVINNHKKNYSKEGYIIPAQIKDWPAEGKGGFMQYLAPFVDVNKNAIYDPENGDYPYVYGVTKSMYCIFNDLKDEHTASFGAEIGLEVHLQVYDILEYNDYWSTTILEYHIISRRPKEYKNISIGFFIGGECGNKKDNYAISNSRLDAGSSFMIYQGDSFDENHFESSKPFACVNFLNARPDGAIVFNNSNGINGKPTIISDFINYSKSLWRNGRPISKGDNGLNPTPTATSKYMFDLEYEQNLGIEPGERNMLGYFNHGKFRQNEAVKFVVALNTGNLLGNKTDDIFDALTIDVRHYNNAVTSNKDDYFKKNLKLYPNPNNGSFTIKNNRYIKNLNIFNNQGVKVYKKEILNNSDIECNVNLASGIYHIELHGKQGTQRTQLCITH